jgi:hypothetical protein
MERWWLYGRRLANKKIKSKGGIYTNIPSKIDVLLKKRTKAAQNLMDADNQLCDWLESKGISTYAPEIADCVRTGAVEICEPATAEQCVREYIENYMPK